MPTWVTAKMIYFGLIAFVGYALLPMPVDVQHIANDMFVEDGKYYRGNAGLYRFSAYAVGDDLKHVKIILRATTKTVVLYDKGVFLIEPKTDREKHICRIVFTKMYEVLENEK